MIPADVLLIVLRTGAILGVALAAGLLARRAPALRLAIYRLGLAAALAVAVVSPWLRESPRPLVPVRWASMPTSVPVPVPATTPLSVANNRSIPAPAPFDPVVLVAPLWFAGSGLLLLRLALGYAGLARVRRSCRTVECPPAGEIAKTLGIAPPTVVEGRAIGSPFVAGVRRATVFLPQGWAPEPDVMRAVLRHELAHVANGDLRWNLFRRIAQIALWPQPLLWPLPRAMDAAGEELCDVQALASGMPSARYAECLLSLRARPTPPLGIGAVASGSSLSRRVEAILDARRSRTTRLSRPLSLALRIGALGLAAGAAFVFARPAPPAAVQDPTEGWIRRPYSGRVRLLSARGKPVVAARAWLVVTGDVPTHEAKALRVEGSEVVLDKGAFSEETTATLVVQAKGHGLGFATAWPTPVALTKLTMPEPVALMGRIVLPSAKPGAGLRLKVTMLVRRSKAGTGFAMLSAIAGLDLGAKTAADGTFRIDGLPPSVSVAYDVDDVRFAQPAYKDHLELGASGTTRARDLILRPAARLTGRVMRDGKPVAGVKIGAQGNHEKSNNADGGGEATTDARGRYAIERLPAGPYNVATDLQRMPDVTAVAHEGVDAKAGRTVSNLDFALIPGVFVAGRVTDEAGNPVRTELGVYGPAHPNSSAWVQTGKTDADGRYRLRVPPGEQYVYLYDSGYTAKAQTVRVVSGTATLDFRVVPMKPESARTATATETTEETPEEDKDPGPVPPVSSFGPGKPFYGPVRLKAGGTVRLAYVQDDEKGSHTLWRPDGGPADRADVAASLNLRGFEAKTAPRRMFARIEAVGVRLDGFDCVVQVPHRSTRSNYQSYGDNANRSLDLVTFQAPRALRVTDLRLGIASGPWSVVRSGKPGTFARLGPASGPVVVTVPMTPALERRNVAVKVYDGAGRALDLALETGTAKDRKTGLLSRSYHFADGNVADIARIDLLARDYEWVTFKGIQLYPRSR